MFRLIIGTDGIRNLININNVTHIIESEDYGNIIHLIGGQTIATKVELNKLQSTFNI